MSNTQETLEYTQPTDDDLLNDVKEFNTGWTAAQRKEPFDDEKSDLWQQGWQIFDYHRLQDKIIELMKIIKDSNE